MTGSAEGRDPRPYSLDIPQADLDDLARRLAATRWPDVQGGDDWSAGAAFPSLRAIQQYWLDDYDWRAQEARLNDFPQYLAEVDGLDIHFFHVPAKGGKGVPLLLLHGWPGSQVEYIDLIGPLTDPLGHGCPDAMAFDVVIPAIPGFGFGGKPREAGWGVDRIAAVFATLMVDVLGYPRFGVQGGDWGTIIGRRMAQNHADRVAALHINMPYAYPPPDAEQPQAWQDFHRAGTAYLGLQGTIPDAIAIGQSDSPMGLAGWILEKFAIWSDCGQDLAAGIPLDALITNLMFYWLPNSAASAARIYLESAREGKLPFGGDRIDVPTGVAAFAAEPYLAPRAWVEPAYNVIRWADFPKGGHFAALEQPQALLGEIRAFFPAAGLRG